MVCCFLLVLLSYTIYTEFTGQVFFWLLNFYFWHLSSPKDGLLDFRAGFICRVHQSTLIDGLPLLVSTLNDRWFHQSPVVVLIKGHSIVTMLQPPALLLASSAHCISLPLLLFFLFAPSCPSFRFPQSPLHVNLPFSLLHGLPLTL